MSSVKNIALPLLAACACLRASAAVGVLPARTVMRSAPDTLLLAALGAGQTAFLGSIHAAHGTIGQFDWRSDASGAVIVVWEQCSADGTDSNIRAQLFDAAGRPLWPARDGIIVNDFRGRQTAPRVAGNARDGFYVVWQSDSAGKNNVNIWCQRITPAGQLAWSAPAAVCTDPAVQRQPAVAVEQDGAALIAWVDYRHGNADIYGQRIEADGAPLLTEDGVAIEQAPGDQTQVRFDGAQPQALTIAWDDHREGFATPVRVETDVSRLPIPEPTGVVVLLCLALLGAARPAGRRVAR